MSVSDEEWIRHKVEECRNPNCDGEMDCIYRDKTPEVSSELYAMIEQEVERHYQPIFDELEATKVRLAAIEERMSHLLKQIS